MPIQVTKYTIQQIACNRKSKNSITKIYIASFQVHSHLKGGYVSIDFAELLHWV